MGFYEPRNTPYGINHLSPISEALTFLLSISETSHFSLSISEISETHISFISIKIFSLSPPSFPFGLFYFNLLYFRFNNSNWFNLLFEMHKLCIPFHYSTSVTPTFAYSIIRVRIIYWLHILTVIFMKQSWGLVYHFHCA